MGIRYIGACCGMEPYHVRAIAEEASQIHTQEYAQKNPHLESLRTLQEG